MARARLLCAIFAASPCFILNAALAQESSTFSYDALGRLTNVSKTGGVNSGILVSTTYDPAGNRSNYSVSGAVTTISVAPATANEGSPLSFVVSRSGITAGASSVAWSTSNGTGVAGTNYTASSGTVSFAPGATSATITVSTQDDNTVTANLGMSVNLASPSGAVLGTASAVGTIINTDGQPTLTIAGASANEGSPLSFVVTRTGSLNAVSVNYTTSNGTAIVGTNYTNTSGTLSLGTGVMSGTITVPTANDNIYTGNLGMAVALSSPSGAVIGTPGSATGTIVNTTPQAQLSIANASANEGSPLSFVVTRTGSIHPVTVNYATSNGSAVAGVNYTNTSGTLSFGSGVTSATVTVPTTNDNVITGNLGMAVNLSAPSSGATLSSGSASGTIVNINTGWTAALTSANWANCGPGYCVTLKGYSSFFSQGSVTPNTFNGYTIRQLVWAQQIPQAPSFNFAMSGSAAPPNSGWTSINVPGIGVLQRSSASYSVSGVIAYWAWSNVGTVSSGTVIIQ